MSPRPKADQPALTQEAIKQTARQQMVAHGTAGLSLRGIARQLNVTAPAIYNYFPRLDDLITALLVDAFTAIAETMEKAMTNCTDERPYARIAAFLHAFRAWALAHPVDFMLMYGNPIPGYQAPAEVATPLARRPFIPLFQLVAQAYKRGELAIPLEYTRVPAPVADHIAAWTQANEIEMPEALVAMLITGWGGIHGLVLLELFNHLQPMVGDPEALYAYELEAFFGRLGIV